MNERIYEIAVQAKIQMVSEPRLQEFAELLIKETLRVAGATPSMTDTVKEHFGVEE